MKDIYDNFNDITINDIELQEIPLEDLEKARYKKNLKKAVRKQRPIGKKALLAAAVAGIMVLGIGSFVVVNPTSAKAIPIISSLFKKDLVETNEDYKNYLDIVGKTISHKGIDVTIESVVADDNVIFLNYVLVNRNKNIRQDYQDALNFGMHINVNGREVGGSGGASWEFLNDNTIRVLSTVHWANDKKDDDMKVKVKAKELYGVKWSWGVQFAMNKSAITSKSIDRPVNKELVIGEDKVLIKNVKFTPLTINVQTKGDEIGKFTTGYRFIMVDSNGQNLKFCGASGKSDYGKIWEENNLVINNKDNRGITIIPMYYDYSNKNDDSLEQMKAYKLDFGKNEKIEFKLEDYLSREIEEYFVDGDYLVVRYVNKYKNNPIETLFRNALYARVNGKEAKELKNSEEANNKYEELYNKYNDRKSELMMFEIGKDRDVEIGAIKDKNIQILSDKAITVDMESK